MVTLSLCEMYLLFAAGVIVFASDQEVAGIMRAVKRLNTTDRFSWIGSDGWSARDLVSDGNEEVVEGTISVQPQANPVKGFNDYFFDLSPKDYVNPYFAGGLIMFSFIIEKTFK